MAVKSSIRPLLRKIVDVIAEYLSSEGLARGEVVILGAWNEQTERIRLVLATNRPLVLQDLNRWYSQLLDRFRQVLDEPGLAPVSWNIGLVLSWTVDFDRAFAKFVVTDEEEDVTEILEGELDARWPPPHSPLSLEESGST
jgi:hypothetical protein